MVITILETLHFQFSYLHSDFIGRAGVPMEVMGLMLGEFVDDYTITCVDVFAMPQVSLFTVKILFLTNNISFETSTVLVFPLKL